MIIRKEIYQMVASLSTNRPEGVAFSLNCTSEEIILIEPDFGMI